MTTTVPAAGAPPVAVPSASEAVPADRRRWVTLGVLCLAVFVTVLDGTIVNVALPRLATTLGATTRQLQWIVDSYLLVFTGLLLAAGSLGDKFGRKRALVVGLVAWGGEPLTPARFHEVFLLAAAIPLLPIPGFLFLKPEDGFQVSGHRRRSRSRRT